MALKFVLFVGLIVAVFVLSSGAPHVPRTEQELVKSFAEFLRQDKAVAAALENAKFGNGEFLLRNRRQAEEDGMVNEQDVQNTNKDGFFDRAAKFVMEVLQRFLKWINTDD